MQKKLLIDASHQEETRIVLLNNQQVEEFDFESINKKQIAGNIFLAKVTRVEPSLQAAFLDYGGNRHGFLAFSEIHPDYYQIPVADKKLLLEDTFDLEDENNNIEVEFSNDDIENFNSYENQIFSSKDLSQIQKIFSFDNNEGADKEADPEMPKTLTQALKRFKSSKILRNYFGQEYIDLYIAVKQGELEYMEQSFIPREEYDFYL